MNEFSLSSQTEQAQPPMNRSRPLSVDPGAGTQQVASTQAFPGNGAGAMLEHAPAAKSTRLFFVDHLRAFLIILVIAGHLAVIYGSIGSFYYHDTTNTLTTYVLTILVMIGQAFSMGLFFLISAYFIPGAYDRQGSGLFLRNRLIRLGLPLLIYDVLIEPFVLYIAAGFPGSYWHFYTTYLLSLRGIGQGPVWFIELLLIFVVCYALWRVCSSWWLNAHPSKAIPTQSIPSAHTHAYPTTRAMLLFIVGLGLLSFVVRIWFPQNWWFGPLNLMFAYIPQYLSLFIVGLVASRRGWFTSMPDAVGKRWLWVALFDFVFLMLLFVLVVLLGLAGSLDAFLGGFHWQALVTAFWEAIMCVSLCTGLLVFFRKHVNRQGRMWNFLSANAYAAYIFHPLILVGLAYGLHSIMLYPLLKYSLAVLIAVPCCFALGALVCMLPYARRIF